MAPVTGAFPGINMRGAACPLVVIVETTDTVLEADHSRQRMRRSWTWHRLGWLCRRERADGNAVLAVYDATKRAVDRARVARVYLSR